MIRSIVVVCIFSLFIISGYAEEQCLKDAWTAFNADKFELAIKHCDICIDEFGRAALRIQTRLEEEKIPPPPTGKVSDAEKNAIFARGLLNDVAAAYFVKGRSAEKLYQLDKKKNEAYKDVANEAFKLTCNYKYGRVWDTQGWFWSPCETAELRLPVE